MVVLEVYVRAYVIRIVYMNNQTNFTKVIEFKKFRCCYYVAKEV